MGLEDRQYYRSEYDDYRGGYAGPGGQTMINILIMINVVVFAADMLSAERVSPLLQLPSDVWQRPWMIYTIVTSGFTHVTWQDGGPWHILVNMFVLWMFGRDVEARLGGKEFLRFYLVAMVLAALAWLACVNLLYGRPSSYVGASGAVMAVFVLSVLYDPKRTLLLFFVIPVPAWAVCIMYVAHDILLLRSDNHVANEAHLAGAAFAALYFHKHWNLGNWVPSRLRLRWPRFSRPNLKVHRPETSGDMESSYRQLEEEGDRILQKMHTQGEASLSAAERKTLEQYSRRMRQKHR